MTLKRNGTRGISLAWNCFWFGGVPSTRPTLTFKALRLESSASASKARNNCFDLCCLGVKDETMHQRTSKLHTLDKGIYCRLFYVLFFASVVWVVSFMPVMLTMFYNAAKLQAKTPAAKARRVASWLNQGSCWTLLKHVENVFAESFALVCWKFVEVAAWGLPTTRSETYGEDKAEPLHPGGFGYQQTIPSGHSR